MKRTVLVTGARGFLGSFITAKLQEKAIPFLEFLRDESSLSSRLSQQKAYYGNLNDAASIRKVMNKCEGVIHLASTLSTDFSTMIGYDVRGMQVMVDSWNKGDFIFTSSIDVYPEVENELLRENSPLAPTNHYGLGKLICEMLLQMKYEKSSSPNLSYKILRLPFVLGKHERFPQSLFGKIIQKALQGHDFMLNDNYTGTSWICADELADSIVNLYNRPISGIFNIASDWIYWTEAIEQIITATKSTSRIIIERKINPNSKGVKGKILDTSKIQRVLGFQPRRKFSDVIHEVLELNGFNQG